MQVLAGGVVHINCNVNGNGRKETDDSNMYSTPDGNTEGDGAATLRTSDGLAVYDFDSDEDGDEDSHMDALYEESGRSTKRRNANTITKTTTLTTESSRGSV